MPAGNTYEAIATQTLGSAAASVTFSSIPSTYTDLVLVYGGSQASQDNFSIQFNSDTGTNYSATTLYGDGTSAASQRFSSTSSIYGPILDATTQSNLIVHIQNYSNSTTYKTSLIRGNSSSFRTTATVGLWRSTSAITSVKCQILGGTNFNSGSVFSLYGIASA
jgi:hypothetical protein